MNEQLLPQDLDKPKKPILRPWKWVGLALFILAIILRRWLPGIPIAVAFLYGFVVIVNLTFHLLRTLKNRLFWKVRNRVISAFFFVGVIPLVVIAGIVYLSLWILLGQLSVNFVETALAEMEQELSWINNDMGATIQSGADQTALDSLAAHTIQTHVSRFPRLCARLAHKRPDGTFETVWRFDPQDITAALVDYPAENWLGNEGSFQGLLREKKTVLLTSLRPVAQWPDHYLDLSAPLDSHIEQRLEKERTIYATFTGVGTTKVQTSNSGIKIQFGSNQKETEAEVEDLAKTQEAHQKRDPRRMVSWGLPLEARDFSTGKKSPAGFFLLSVPIEVLYKHYLSGSYQLGEMLLKVVFILLILFVVVELVSLISGGAISRRITRSVHDMYQGTLALQKGDLQHKIPVRRNDQLGMLAHSFNQMSGSIVRLLEEVSEKKRLEQELEIAREVQATLFPRQLPHPRGLSVFGGCEPARVVSGDYYDFVVEDEARLSIIVGDISGKGISAALLMANLQAAMRNQLMSIKTGSQAEVEQRMGEVMIQLNQQIYQNSPSEKYATLFLSRYDAEARRLFYCNAGHLPPIFLIDGEARRLESDGMVLGLFPNVQYSASSIELAPGTVLAVFTDGVTEAFNTADEEFGDDRLIEALLQVRSYSSEAIYRHVVDQVQKWQGALPQHDDITLIVAKVE